MGLGGRVKTTRPKETTGRTRSGTERGGLRDNKRGTRTFLHLFDAYLWASNIFQGMCAREKKTLSLKGLTCP